MKICVTTESNTFPLEVSDDMELENIRVLCEMEIGIPSSQLVIAFNRVTLTDAKKSLKDYGIKDGDMLMVLSGSGLLQRAASNLQQMRPNPRSSEVSQFDFGSIQIPGGQSSNQTNNSPAGGASSSASLSNERQDLDSETVRESNGANADNKDLGLGNVSGNQDDPAVIRDMILANPEQLSMLKQNNPKLADALTSGDLDKFASVLKEQQESRRERERQRIRLLTADPFDIEAQRIIAEEIQQENINANMEAAMEFNPESFGTVHMLYINCVVNGHPVKAFIDSGAQTTIMSQACAQRCNIMRLVDQRWAGIAKGVGTQKIIGRVHMGQIQIGKGFLASSFCILEEQAMDMLLGLDMIKRHQMCIDLKRNELIIGTTGTSTRFLPESELPACARLSFASEEEIRKQSEMSAKSSEDQALAQALSQSAQEAQSNSSSASQSNSQSNHAACEDPFSESDIEELIQIGFSRNQVVIELRKQNGDKTQAIAALFAKSLKK